MALEIEVRVKGRNHIRIDHKPLGWLIHTATGGSAKQESPSTVNSRVTRLYKKLEVMPVGLHQSGTRSRADCEVHLFPTVIKVNFGGAGSFTPLSDRIFPTSRIASYGTVSDYP